jgi:sortase A
MDNQKGGQTSTPPSWNAWGQAAAKNAADTAQQSKVEDKPAELTSAQKQQQTATELARKRVLEAYKKTPQDYKAPSQSSPTPVANADDWRKYHSAWQDYYQKYYGEYYGKVAREYVARERLRIEREQAEKERKNEDANQQASSTLATVATAGTKEESEIVQDDFRARIRAKAEQRARKMKRGRKWIPLVVGIIVLVIGVLYQYNQVIAAHVVAYMSPGNAEVNSISDLDPTITVATHQTPTVMIPKINVEVPVTFGAKTDVQSMNAAMTNGVANFSIPGASAKPGQIGNFVISGHSGGDPWQRSDYKFIFSGLPRLAVGDMIYMDYEGTRYAYKMTGTMIVDPSDVNSLRKIASDNAGKPMITLLTCYPLGTSKQRYIVYAEQVSPSYEGAASDTPTDGSDDKTIYEMPKNDPLPLEAFWRWLTGQQ